MSKTQAPDPAQALPQFIRSEVEWAIAKAAKPTGMSTHDGRAHIGHDKLRYMLALIDSQAAKLAAIPAPEGALREAAKGALTVLDSIGQQDMYAEQWAAVEALRAALAAPAPQATDAELERRTGEPHVDGWPLVSGLPAPKAPRALTRDEVDELFADGLGFEPKAAIVREIVAEFCRVNGIPAPQTKEPTNDR